MIPLHDLDCLQNEINLKAVAEHMGQRFFRVGIQNGFSLRIDISSSVNFESLAIVNYPSFRLVYHLHPLSSKHSALLFLLVCYFHCPGMRTLC